MEQLIDQGHQYEFARSRAQLADNLKTVGKA
jgi:hypothetical protein